MASPIIFTATKLAAQAADFRLAGEILPDDSEAGGFAKLMRATRDDGAPVAIKRFHRHNRDGAEYDADGVAALREFECLCELSGAEGHAPAPFALGTCTDKQGLIHHAIAMEYVEGFTIEQALASGVLSGDARSVDKTNAILGAALHIIDAIEACDRRVVHRDISPANIILTMGRAGEVKRAVLIDWGQSISARSPLVTPALGENRKLATICFGAPCVFGGPYYQMRNDPSVDVYGFGALLYYMRTLELPYADIAASHILTPETVEAVAAAKRDPLTLAGKMPSMRAIEKKLDGIIGACTAYDPRERPDGTSVRRLIAEALALPEATRAPASANPFADSTPARTCEDARHARRPAIRQDATTIGSETPSPYGARTCSTDTVASLNTLLQALEKSKRVAEKEKAATHANESPGLSIGARRPGLDAADIAANENANVSPREKPNAGESLGETLFRQATDCFYGHGGAARDAARSAQLLERAAEAGCVEAMFTLAKNLLFGIGIARDEQRGARWLKRAAACGHPGAEALL